MHCGGTWRKTIGQICTEGNDHGFREVPAFQERHFQILGLRVGILHPGHQGLRKDFGQRIQRIPPRPRSSMDLGIRRQNQGPGDLGCVPREMHLFAGRPSNRVQIWIWLSNRCTRPKKRECVRQENSIYCLHGKLISHTSKTTHPNATWLLQNHNPKGRRIR